MILFLSEVLVLFLTIVKRNYVLKSNVIKILYICLIPILAKSQTKDLNVVNSNLLSPSHNRYITTAVQADLSLLSSTQERLIKLNQGLIGSNDYAWVKAQRWLDLAQDEYRNNNRGLAPQQALGESIRLIDLVDKPDSFILASDTPLLVGSLQIRNDLWERIHIIKRIALDSQHPKRLAAQCSLAAVAYAEVQLTWASWVNATYNWRSALPYITHAERVISQADKQFKECEVTKIEELVTNPSSFEIKK
jgi:hypothetical protein